MKHLPKYLRPRWRYLAVAIETWPDATLDRRSFQREVWYAAQNLVGDVGSADADLSVVEFEFADGVGEAIVRVRRGEETAGRAVLASLARVDGDPVGLRVRGVSGTVRACEEKYMGRAPEEPEQRDVVFGNADRSALVRGERLDVREDGAFAGATAFDLR